MQSPTLLRRSNSEEAGLLTYVVRDKPPFSKDTLRSALASLENLNWLLTLGQT